MQDNPLTIPDIPKVIESINTLYPGEIPILEVREIAIYLCSADEKVNMMEFNKVLRKHIACRAVLHYVRQVQVPLDLVLKGQQKNAEEVQDLLDSGYIAIKNSVVELTNKEYLLQLN